MESLNGGGTPPEKPNKLIALVNRFLRRGQNQLPEQAKEQEILPDNPEEVAERDRLAWQVSRKIIKDILADGFIVIRDMGKEVRGDPWGPDVWVNTYSQIGYSNSSGKRYRAELDSSRIVGGPISDELTLEVSDRQDAELIPPDQHEERRLIINREHDKVANTDTQEMSVTRFRFHRGNEEESGTFNLPISEQIQFLRELLDLSIDAEFTKEMARVAEERVGKVTWNRDNPNPSINLGSGSLLPPK